MKKVLIIIFFSSMLYPVFLKAQIQNVVVETYYVSDANDATDTTDGRILAEGSKTYRVYVEIIPGSRIKKLFGDELHPLQIISTDTFFNNIDRPNSYFGYLINKTWFQSNPTLALDSWLTLGLAASTQSGVLKTHDTNGSLIGGTNNNGGTAGVPGGLLVNEDSSAGEPLTNADGFMPKTATLGQWIDNGFKDILTGTDTTIFGPENQGTQFISTTAYLQQNSGVIGASSDSNRVLVAQLTTRGEISFALNLEIIDTSGIPIHYVSTGHDTTYVLSGQTIIEKYSPFLTYPTVCGCRDPHYLEYGSFYSCDNFDSCRTRIKYGCMDPNACNYDPGANFNIDALCCYPGRCNDRDIAIVCPEISNVFRLYPNPAHNEISFEVSNDSDNNIRYELYNAFGRNISGKNLDAPSGVFSIDLSDLNSGLYMLRIYKGNVTESKMFLKD